MVRLTALLSIASTLVLLASASQDTEVSRFNRIPSRTTSPGVARRSPFGSGLLSKRCSGTCAQCFGSSYTECPNSDSLCYLPGSSTYGIDSCYGDDDDGDSTSTATSSAASSTYTGSDTCYGADETCASCFGSGFLECPDDESYCYNPDDPTYDTCPSDSGSGSTTIPGDYDTATTGYYYGTTSTADSDDDGTATTDSYYYDTTSTADSDDDTTSYIDATSTANAGVVETSATSATADDSTSRTTSTTKSTSTSTHTTATTTSSSSSSSSHTSSAAESHMVELKIMAVVLGLLGAGMMLL